MRITTNGMLQEEGSLFLSGTDLNSRRNPSLTKKDKPTEETASFKMFLEQRKTERKVSSSICGKFLCYGSSNIDSHTSKVSLLELKRQSDRNRRVPFLVEFPTVPLPSSVPLVPMSRVSSTDIFHSFWEGINANVQEAIERIELLPFRFPVPVGSLPVPSSGFKVSSFGIRMITSFLCCSGSGSSFAVKDIAVSLGGRRKNYVPVHSDFTNWNETRGFYEFGKYLELMREAEGYKENPPRTFSVPSVYWKITDHTEANRIKSWLLEQEFEITVPRFQNQKLLRGRFLYSKIEDSQSIKFERIVTRHVWEFRYDADRFNTVDVGRYFPVVILKVPREGSKVPKEVPVPVPVKSVIRRRK